MIPNVLLKTIRNQKVNDIFISLKCRNCIFNSDVTLCIFIYFFHILLLLRDLLPLRLTNSTCTQVSIHHHLLNISFYGGQTLWKTRTEIERKVYELKSSFYKWSVVTLLIQKRRNKIQRFRLEHLLMLSTYNSKDSMYNSLWQFHVRRA